MQAQRSTKKYKLKSLYLTIYKLVASGKNAAKISKELNIKKSLTEYYFSRLKSQGLIRNIGYGTWEILKDFEEKKPKKVPSIVPPHGMARYGKNLYLFSGKIRAHGFQFSVKMQEKRNSDTWKSFLAKNNIPFREIKLGFGISLRINYHGSKIGLFKNLIIVYQKSDYIQNTADKATTEAIQSLNMLCMELESFLKIRLFNKGFLDFSIDKCHYAHLNDATAKMFRKQGDKLFIKDDNGTIRLIADFSNHIDEFEAINAKTARIDIKKAVEEFYQGLLKVDNFNPELISESIMVLGKIADAHTKEIERIREKLQYKPDYFG